ncbi:hypothetical protein Adu01nite_18130 [Paractinoplanes durhamensis]|uniref:Uncharacterized protein n=2 Tax=Paractinoplanes durhamensis TaxID=113563 RepID=A0ABQ3YSF2_9ACTN|nr:hypothetical protein [Actinoplanes durhamensis]GIE00463.1 hypothetical protein Adu01nite_18130 [Actinoplanes durhamensis]
MRHLGARALTALALVAASLAWASPASADVQGFAVSIGQNPATFTIGKQARTLTAVATTDRQRRCVKVRWSLTVRTDGVSLDQLKITRIEDDQSFRVRAQLDNDAARIVDAQLDPGQLCRDQTVTGRWDIAFAGPDDGQVTFEAQALDAAGRVLATTSTTSRVVTAVAAKPSASASASPSPSATDPDEQIDQPVADATTPAGNKTSAAALNPASGTPSVLGPGLIIGAVLVFLGVALLLRIRTRNRKSDPAWQTETQALPTGFYSMPRRRQ